MSTQNDHIKEYLLYYLALGDQPGFAVLLNGEWGCGKTCFIKRFISDYEKLHPKQLRFLYITLYGLTVASEIEDQIFQQLHPILSSKTMVLAGKFLKGFLKTSLKVDLDKDSGSSATVTPDLKEADIPGFLRKTDNCVFVFDDLERCRMPLSVTLGYINSFVEHQGSKVIIIANESELDKNQANSTGGAEEYRKIKEKLVGKTFTVFSDFDSALDAFLDQIRSSVVREFLKSKKQQIADTFGRAGFNNLRHLHRAFLEFERLHKSLSESHRQLPRLLDDLLSVFLALSFELQAGKLHPSHIRGFMSKVAKGLMSKNRDATPPPPAQVVAEKHGLTDKMTLILSDECWSQFFEKGFISPQELAESIENSPYAQNQTMPAWLKLWYTWDLEETEFSQLVAKVTEQFAKGELQRPGEILHVAGMLLSLSDLGLISKSLVDTLNDCRTYLDKIAAREVWSQEDVRSFLFPKFGPGDTYFNHGIYGTDLKEVKEFRAYLENHIQRTLDKLLPSKAKDLLLLLAKDPSVFARNIVGHNPDDPIYHDTPIFKNIGPRELIDVLLEIPNKDKRIVGKALGERYQIEQMSRHLMGEKEFLMELKRLLEIEIQDSTKPLTAYILKTQVLNNISSALTTLENRGSMDKQRGLTVPDQAKDPASVR